AVGDSSVILRTDNSGVQWQRIEHTYQSPLKSVHLLNPQVGWMAGENGTILRA
ncbi:MAG: hypothetical protein JST20_14415, partial [Bacteroidetes bacterium]|nr:hypothetical protein [Bacteroidota bacterium]